MPFPPEEFFAVAERLRDGNSIAGEGRHRTVAGRAYYGAYLVTCREICRLRGINPPQNFDHETLCHTLAGFRDDEQVRKFGTLLDGLRQRRVHADYHMSPEMYDGAADDAIDDARSALGMLPVVVARFPRIDPRPPRH